MDLKKTISSIIDRIDSMSGNCIREEATKTSFVLPMINALGYDIFNPLEVVPEFIADIGRKKGEKVDYAIMIKNKPLILIEVKQYGTKLDRHISQLERYFTVTDSKFAILTDGVKYRFYSDLNETNRMDRLPFLTLDISDMKDSDYIELEKFTKSTIDIDMILSMAEVNQSINSIKSIFREEIDEPSDDIARFFASKVCDKILRQNIVDEYKILTKKALREVIDELIEERLTEIKDRISKDTQKIELPSKSKIVTTQEEIEGFEIVKAILSETIASKNITYKDTTNYFGILLNGNSRKWICRLYLNSAKNKFIVLQDKNKEIRFDINYVSNIYQYKAQLKTVAIRLHNIV